MELIPRAAAGLPPSEASRRPVAEVVGMTVHYTTGQELGRENTAEWWHNIYHDHTERRGWDDVGYHYGIDAAGRVYEGRPVDRVGAHAGTSKGNRRWLGVAFLGNDDPGVNDVTPEARGAFVTLLAELDELFGHELRVNGHRDHKPTTCPGDELYAFLVPLRRRATAEAGPPAVSDDLAYLSATDRRRLAAAVRASGHNPGGRIDVPDVVAALLR